MRTSESSKNRRRAKKMTGYYECSVCQYVSERYYNVSRHEIRIHTASAKQRTCCKLKFVTKGDYYLHCQECHPISRPANVTSRTKYHIDSGLKKVNPPEASVSQENGQIHKTVSQSRYMLRTRKNSQFLTKYEDESDEDSELSEVSEYETSSGGSSSGDSAQRSLAYGGKTEFSNVNKNDLETAISMNKTSDFDNEEKYAETESTETANSDNSLDRSAGNDAAIDSGFFDEFAVSSSTELADENSPIAIIDWCTNFENYGNFHVTNELVDPASQIHAVDGATNFENIENVQLTNVLVPPNSHIGTIDWCTNFEDVETQPEQNILVLETSQIDWSSNLENVKDSQQRNESAEQSFEIVAIDWSPKVADVEDFPVTNEAPDGDSKTSGLVHKNIESSEASQQEENEAVDSKLKRDTIDWCASLKNLKTWKTKNTLEEIDSKNRTIEWCQNSGNFANSPEKKPNLMDVPKWSYNLPIKKRILRLIPKVESNRQETATPGRLLVDRLHDQLKRENKVELKTRKKSRPAEQGGNKKSRGTRDNKENINPSSLQFEGKVKKEETPINYGSIAIHVDPRISFHNLTQAHHEFFERLLANQSLSDRINCTEN